MSLVTWSWNGRSSRRLTSDTSRPESTTSRFSHSEMEQPPKISTWFDVCCWGSCFYKTDKSSRMLVVSHFASLFQAICFQNQEVHCTGDLHLLQDLWAICLPLVHLSPLLEVSPRLVHQVLPTLWTWQVSDWNLHNGLSEIHYVPICMVVLSLFTDGTYRENSLGSGEQEHREVRRRHS